MGRKGSLLCSLEPATARYPDPGESIPHLANLFL
jgi:hypothetical protein